MTGAATSTSSKALSWGSPEHPARGSSPSWAPPLRGRPHNNALFENPGHGNHWIVLGLEGVRSNRPGIGARLNVVVQTTSGQRVIHKTVRSGGSFGASPLRQEIGLGLAERVLRVEILWPSGGPPQILEGLELDRRYIVREGSGVRALNLKPFKLGTVTP